MDICEKDPDAREVTETEGQKLANKYLLGFKEASALDNINVSDVFIELL